MLQPLVYWAHVLVVAPQVTVFQCGHSVQVQLPLTGQPLVVQPWSGEPGHALPPFAGAGAEQVLDCVPAVAPSADDTVHSQAPQSDQRPSTRQPLVVQVPEPSDQVPAVSLSYVFAVHTQVRCRLQVPLVLVQLPLLALQE